MATGLPIPRWGTNPVHGTEVADARQMVAAMYHSYGVIKGCEVTTSPTAMAYKVAAGIAVGTRGGSYGAVISSVPAGSVTTTAAPASGSRIDVIYAAQHDPTQGDKDGECLLGVAQGAAGASPVKPAIPAGAVELAAYQVPSGAATTASATLSGTAKHAIPYGGTLGVIAKGVDTSSSDLPDGESTVVQLSFSLPTTRILRFDITTSLLDVIGPGATGSCYLRLSIDGSQVRMLERQTNKAATVEYYSEVCVVDAGIHTASLTMWNGISRNCRYYGETRWPGQVLVVSDEGIA